MAKTVLTSPRLSQPVGVFSQATMVSTPGRMIFVSGLTARDMDGKVVGIGDASAQTRQVLENLKAILVEAGATLDDIVRVTVYIRNMADFKAIHQVRAQYFTANPPASTMVEVSRLVDEDMLIEIEATAVLTD